MVSSGTISSDMSSLSTSLSSYETCITGLHANWQGDSYDNIAKQATSFLSEYKSAIEKQMQAFASAVATYQEYKQVKQQLQAAQAALSSLTEDDPGKANYYGIISSCQEKLEQLKASIEASLAAASTPSLGSSTAITNAQTTGHLNIYQGIRRGSRELTNAVTVDEVAPTTTGTVRQVLTKAIEIAQDDTHGYSQQTRYGNPNYDCSSFVITCWDSAGTGVKAAGAKTTHNMRKAFTSTGLFEWIPGNPKVEDLRPGDVLLNETKHTEMYIGEGFMVGAHGDFDNVNGDGNGRELGVCPYSGAWEGILRYKGDQPLTNIDLSNTTI